MRILKNNIYTTIFASSVVFSQLMFILLLNNVQYSLFLYLIHILVGASFGGMVTAIVWAINSKK